MIVDFRSGGMTNDGHQPRTSTRHRKADFLDGAGGAFVEVLLNTKAVTVIGPREEHRILPMILKVARREDRTNIEEETLAKRKATKLRLNRR